MIKKVNINKTKMVITRPKVRTKSEKIIISNHRIIKQSRQEVQNTNDYKRLIKLF